MIDIYPSPTADTRTATQPVSKETLLESSKMHIDDVRRGMMFLADLVRAAALPALAAAFPDVDIPSLLADCEV